MSSKPKKTTGSKKVEKRTKTVKKTKKREVSESSVSSDSEPEVTVTSLKEDTDNEDVSDDELYRDIHKLDKGMEMLSRKVAKFQQTCATESGALKSEVENLVKTMTTESEKVDTVLNSVNTINAKLVAFEEKQAELQQDILDLKNDTLDLRNYVTELYNRPIPEPSLDTTGLEKQCRYQQASIARQQSVICLLQQQVGFLQEELFRLKNILFFPPQAPCEQPVEPVEQPVNRCEEVQRVEQPVATGPSVCGPSVSLSENGVFVFNEQGSDEVKIDIAPSSE